MSKRTVPDELATVHATVRQAIVDRQQLLFVYEGHRREVCPHSLGWKENRLACFAFQFAGGSRTPLPPDGEWRCFHLDRMTEVHSRTGPWRTGPAIHLNSSCIDYFEASVESG